MPESGESNLPVQVTIENLGPCKRLLKIELPTASVDAEFERVTVDYTRYARLPGFRPGKAPRNIVEKRFAAEIEQEVQRSLIPKSYRDALDKQSLRPVGYPDIKDVQFGRGKPLAFTAELETEPEFPLPDYKGIPVKRQKMEVTDEDVAKALETLAEQRAELADVAGRPLAMDDFAVVNFTAVSDGKPLNEIVPDAKALANRQNLLLLMSAQSFVPGFCEQLVGAAAGDQRQVQVEFPADFQVKPLAGKKATYSVDITGIKTKKSPPIDDAFAASFGQDLTLEKLKEAVKQDIARERARAASNDEKNQIVEQLLSRTTIDLPPAMLANETRNAIQNLVQENTARGVTRETLVEKKDEIFQFASKSATDRLKASFILGRIAALEKIQLQQAEVDQRIAMLGYRHNIPYPKLRKQLEERGGIHEVEEEILIGKTLEFLLANASVSQQ